MYIYIYIYMYIYIYTRRLYLLGNQVGSVPSVWSAPSTVHSSVSKAETNSDTSNIGNAKNNTIQINDITSVTYYYYYYYY